MDICDECRIYGDDYDYNDDGELVRRCPQCPFEDVYSEREGE